MRKTLKCQVEDCPNIIHSECAGLRQGNDWSCSACETPITLEAIMKQIKELCRINTTMQHSIDLSHEKIEENCNLVKKLDAKIEHCLSSVDELTARCNSLEKRNMEIISELNQLEQYSRSNCVDIVGIPEINGECVYTTVFRVAQILGVHLVKNEIDCCHRIGRVAQPNQHRNIIVKFANRWKKEEFIAARRVRQNLRVRDLTLDIPNIKMSDLDHPVYVNESLTRSNRQLLAKCREFRKTNKVQFLWIRRGQILMRMAEKSAVVVIKNEVDLNKLKI